MEGNNPLFRKIEHKKKGWGGGGGGGGGLLRGGGGRGGLCGGGRHGVLVKNAAKSLGKKKSRSSAWGLSV